ncbi:hypothetical protein [Streptomyces sp. NPDC088789]|uniref:hypothetical protein n=1 Tax=Streptomyces sp. NPDC088789 TaxID=3365899 RepID=UPI0038085ED6
MSRLARPAARLASGSAMVARRLTARTGAWIARGRRDDLTGWRGELGCWARAVTAAVGLYLLWRAVRAVPAVMWLLTGAWIIAAWRAGKPAPGAAWGKPDQEHGHADQERGGTEPDDDAASLDVLEVVGVIRRVAARHPRHLGVHLADLLPEPEFTGWDQGDLKAALTGWGLPVVSFKLTFPDRARTREGVRLEHLPAAPAGPGGEGSARGLAAVSLQPPAGGAPGTPPGAPPGCPSGRLSAPPLPPPGAPLRGAG